VGTGNPTEPGRRAGSAGLFSRSQTAEKTHVVKLEWREYITQVIVLTELLIDYGWPKELVAFDPEARGAWTFDLAVFHDRAAVPPWRIAVETKSPISARELDALRDALTGWALLPRRLSPQIRRSWPKHFGDFSAFAPSTSGSERPVDATRHSP
jgi:hypothetical protein